MKKLFLLQSLVIRIFLMMSILLCIYTTSLLASTSLNISYTRLCLFSLHFFSENNYGLSILTLCLPIVDAFILTVKSDFIVSLFFLDLLCIQEIFDFSKSTSSPSYTFFSFFPSFHFISSFSSCFFLFLLVSSCLYLSVLLFLILLFHHL